MFSLCVGCLRRFSPAFWGRGEAYVALLVSMMLVGSYVALSKSLLVFFPPFALAWVRFLIAAVVMWPWLHSWRGQVASVPVGDRWVLFGMSFFGNFLFTVCMLLGVARTSATAAGIIMSLLPAVVGVVSVWWLRERLTRVGGVSIVLAVLGVGFLSLSKDASGQSWLGNVFILGALVCEALYVVGAKYLSGGYSPKQVAVAMNSFGLLLTTPLAWLELPSVAWGQIGVQGWALMVFYALAASVGSTWLWFNGLRHVPASRAGVFTVALPLTAALIGVWVFGEVWSVFHVAALVCALGGVLISALWSRPV